MLMVDNPKNINFDPPRPTAKIRSKTQNFNIEHGGILSMENFIKIIKTIFHFK
jgi:hypothetical protein